MLNLLYFGGDAAQTNPAPPPAPLQQSAVGGSMIGSIGSAVADGISLWKRSFIICAVSVKTSVHKKLVKTAAAILLLVVR